MRATHLGDGSDSSMRRQLAPARTHARCRAPPKRVSRIGGRWEDGCAPAGVKAEVLLLLLVLLTAARKGGRRAPER